MRRKNLFTLLATATLSLSAGCTSSGGLPAWSRTSPFHRGNDSAVVSGESAAADPKNSAKTSRKEELSPEFREAQKMFKNTEKTLLAWARYQEDIGEYAEARRMYHELQLAYPKNIEAHLGMARIEELTGRSRQAEQILSDLKKKYPDNSSVRIELGRLYSKQEEWDKAIREFEDACEIEPEDQNCRYELGVAFARAGKFDQALSHLSFAVGAPAANYNIGYILYEQGKTTDAAEWIQNALRLHPDQRTAEKSKVMLAKLQPPAGQPAGNSASVAQHSLPTESGTARAQGYPSSTHKLASQFTPAPVVAGRRTEPPYVAAAQPEDGIPLPAAESGYPATGRSLPAVSSGHAPFHAVSMPKSGETGNSVYSSEQPPQWNGPSAQTSEPSRGTPAPSQDPPNWRARNQ
jgi:tetratricopeptide (TPR) repeat protein